MLTRLVTRYPYVSACLLGFALAGIVLAFAWPY